MVRIVNAGTCCTRWNSARSIHRSGDERRSGSGIYDYMKLFAEQVRTYVPADDYRYWVLMASVVPTAVRTCVTT